MEKTIRQNKSILYVNYSPYENAGKILDYLTENFYHVFAFSLGFHQLKNKKNVNSLTIYKQGKIEKEYTFFRLSVSPRLVFILIPVRSVLTIVQMLAFGLFIRAKYGRIDFYLSVNAFTAWIGIFFHSLRIVKKTIFWVWDYYPLSHPSKVIRLMRYIYSQFDKIAGSSDQVAFVNQRLLRLRKEMGWIVKGKDYPIVPVGTDKFKVRLKQHPELVFGFIGVIKKSHGLGIVFDHEKEILKEFPKVKYEIIGSGPEEEYFWTIAKKSQIETRLHGFIEGESFNEILKKCTVGIATYFPDPSNVSHFGDPGKIKRYLSLGIPVLTTDVVEFSKVIADERAGEVIGYDDPKQFVRALQRIFANYPLYQRNALRVSALFYYSKIYKKMFDL